MALIFGLLGESAGVTTYDFIQYGNLAGWYNTSFSTTITLNSSQVSQINDLSGNGLHLKQATSSQNPDWASSDSSIQFLSANATVLSSTAAPSFATGTMFVVFGFQTGVNSISRIFQNANATVSAGMRVNTNSSTSGLIGVTCGTIQSTAGSTATANQVKATTTVLVSGTRYLATAYVQGSGGNIAAAINGNSFVTQALTGFDITSTNALSMGNNVGGTTSQAFQGKIYEALVFGSTLDTTTIATIQSQINSYWSIY